MSMVTCHTCGGSAVSGTSSGEQHVGENEVADFVHSFSNALQPSSDRSPLKYRCRVRLGLPSTCPLSSFRFRRIDSRALASRVRIDVRVGGPVVTPLLVRV
jgi:hypothetical protein